MVRDHAEIDKKLKVQETMFKDKIFDDVPKGALKLIKPSFEKVSNL